MPGVFSDSKYEANSGDIYAVRVQPETLTLALGTATNTAPTATIDQQITAKVSGSRRGYGVHVRKVTVRLTAAKTGYKENATLTFPWLQQDTWEALPAKATGTYDGTAVVLVGKTSEKIK
jgi:hypothetical protein